MTDCNSCGRCCNPVVFSFQQIDIATQFPDPDASPYEALHPRNRDWIVNDLTPIPRKIGKAMVADHMAGFSTYYTMDKRTGRIVPGSEVKQLSYFYECKHYDKETGDCGIYDNRPGLCEGFPWYGIPLTDSFNQNKSLPPECSYNADIGKPVNFIGRKR